MLLLLCFIATALCFDLIQPVVPRDNVLSSSFVYYTIGSKEFILSHGGQVGVVDANNTLSDLWRFSLSDSTWEKLPSNGSPRLTEHLGFWRKSTNSILFCGGYTPSELGLSGNYLLYEYSIANNSWSYMSEPQYPLFDIFGLHFIEENNTVLAYRKSMPTLVMFQPGSKDYKVIANTVDFHLGESIHKLLYFKEIDTAFLSGGTYTTFEDIYLTIHASSQFTHINITEESPSWVYDSLPTALSDNTMLGAYPYIYIWGGCKNFSFVMGNGVKCIDMSSTLFIYNVETQLWSNTETNLALEMSSSIITPNAIYVYGGRTINGGFNYNLYKLDLVHKPINSDSSSSSPNLLARKQAAFPLIVAMLLLVMFLFAATLLVLFIILKKLKPKQDITSVPLTTIYEE